MATFVAVMHRDPGSDYGVSFPDFPGCVTAAASIDEAVREAREALAFHIDGMVEHGEPLPGCASAVAEVLADPDFADGVPFLVTVDLPGRAVRVNISLEEGLVHRIDLHARQRGMSRSAFLAEGARQLIASAARGGAALESIGDDRR